MRLAIPALALLAFAIALAVWTRGGDPTRPAQVAAPVTPPAAPPPATPPPVTPPIPAGSPAPSLPYDVAAATAARTEREHLLARIDDHLSGHEDWNDRGIELLEQIGHGALATTGTACHMAGCAATFTFASQCAFESTRDAVAASADYVAWTGAKDFSTPEALPDGKVVVAVVFERPN
jgi:hypothetical protein